MSNSDTTHPAAPRVFIAMPIYNEERFIASTLGALLAQDYPALTSLVSDNASDDRTAEICRRLADGDARVRYVRQPANMGVVANHRWVLEQREGEYFVWAGGHDPWSPDLARLCVEALEANRDAVIAIPTSRRVDAQGDPFARRFGYTVTRDMHLLARFFTVFCGNAPPVLGMIRSRCLRLGSDIRECVGADLILLAQLAFEGDFVHVPGAAWCRREPRSAAIYDDKLRRCTSADFAVTRAWPDRLFPLLRLPPEPARVAWSARRPWYERAAMVPAIAGSLPVRYLAGRE